MCSRQNSLGKGGLNERATIVKAKRREFIECDFLPLIPDGTMYEIKQYAEYVDLNIVFSKKNKL